MSCILLTVFVRTGRETIVQRNERNVNLFSSLLLLNPIISYIFLPFALGKTIEIQHPRRRKTRNAIKHDP